MIAQRTFSNSPESVTQARHYAAALLSGAPVRVIESTKLIVSELASNCLRHAHSGFEVDIKIDDGRVWVAITDTGDGEPELRTPELTDVSGRGLQIVELLANEWGVVSEAPGKTVWASLYFDNYLP